MSRSTDKIDWLISRGGELAWLLVVFGFAVYFVLYLFGVVGERP